MLSGLIHYPMRLSSITEDVENLELVQARYCQQFLKDAFDFLQIQYDRIGKLA